VAPRFPYSLEIDSICIAVFKMYNIRSGGCLLARETLLASIAVLNTRSTMTEYITNTVSQSLVAPARSVSPAPALSLNTVRLESACGT